jgi:hypothetical protein
MLLSRVNSANVLMAGTLCVRGRKDKADNLYLGEEDQMAKVFSNISREDV